MKAKQGKAASEIKNCFVGLTGVLAISQRLFLIPGLSGNPHKHKPHFQFCTQELDCNWCRRRHRNQTAAKSLRNQSRVSCIDAGWRHSCELVKHRHLTHYLPMWTKVSAVRVVGEIACFQHVSSTR